MRGESGSNSDVSNQPITGIIEVGESKMTGFSTMPPEKSDEDEKRDEGLLRMLKARPKRREELKLGKPRNPRGKKKTENKKSGRRP